MTDIRSSWKLKGLSEHSIDAYLPFVPLDFTLEYFKIWPTQNPTKKKKSIWKDGSDRKIYLVIDMCFYSMHVSYTNTSRNEKKKKKNSTKMIEERVLLG